MRTNTSAALGAVLGQLQGAAAFSWGKPAIPQKCNLISRDVVVVGGGSAGTHTAVRLVEHGKSIAVVDIADQLGGHVQTYHDPPTGLTDNSAVKSFYNISIARDYWKTLGIEPAPDRLRLGSNPIYFDFDQGQVVPGYTGTNTTAGLAAYRKALANFPELIDGFDTLPNPIPEDLLLPFGKFAAKYGVEEAVSYISLFGQGGADYYNTPTMYVAKYLGEQFLDAVANGLIVPSSYDNHELYAKALQYLKPENVFLNTRVTSSKRTNKGVTINTLSANNTCTTIKAKQLIVAVPHILENLAPLDLDRKETELFSKISGFDYYGGLIRYLDFPTNVTYANTGTNTTYHLGPLPNCHTIIQSTIHGIIDVKYGAGYNSVSQSEAKAGIIENFNSILSTLGSNYTKITEKDFVKIASYGPYTQFAPVEDVKAGLYKKMWSLQGKRSTFYTGAVWQAQDSAMIWNFTEHRVLPLILGQAKL